MENKQKKEKYQGERHADKFADVKSFEQIPKEQDGKDKPATNAGAKPIEELKKKVNENIDPIIVATKAEEKSHEKSEETAARMKSVSDADSAAINRTESADEIDY